MSRATRRRQHRHTEPLLRLNFGATATQDEADLDTVRQATHDQLLADLGDTRRSGVTWHHYDAAAGLEVLDDVGITGPKADDLRAYLRDNPDGVLVIASAEAVPE